MNDNKSSQPEPIDAQPQDTGGKMSKSGVIFTILVAVIVLFIIFDPFGLIARLQGTGDPLAKFIPADTVIYMNIDLLQVTSDDTEEIFNIFQRGAGVTYGEGDSLVGQIDRFLEELFNLTYSDDIVPWVGQYFSVSVSDLVLDDWGNVESGEVLIVVEAKPTQEDKVDGFIQKLVAAMEESIDGPFEKVEYDDITLYEYQSGYPGEDVAIGRYENILFISNGSQNIISAVNLESSQSLAEDDDYQSIIKKMPGKRMLSFSMDMAVFPDLYGSMPEDLGEAFSNPMSWAVFSISTKSYGLEYNTAIVQDLENMTESQREAIIASKDFNPKTDEMFPEDTFLYLVGNRLDNTINLLLENESYEVQDIKESLDMFKHEYQIDLLRLINSFDGELAMGLVQNSDGLLSTSLGGEVGVELELIIETSQEDVILDEFKMLNLLAGLDPSLFIEEYSKNNMLLFDIGMDAEIQTINYMTYGVGGGYAVFSTSPSLVDDSFDGGPSLADNPRYKKAVNSFPSGYELNFFLDVQGILNIIKEDMDEYAYEYLSESYGVIEPITAIASASDSSGNINFGSIIIFIDISK